MALKTYKLWIGGEFARSESGRTYEALTAKGRFLANVPLASRKDLRDAVGSARKGQAAWAKMTAYNRGQVLYRMAEMLEGRTDELAGVLAESTGQTIASARAETVAMVDRWIYYAGWTDKFSALVSSVNPVAHPMHNFSEPQPTGVVGVVCPDEAPLLSLVSLVAPILAGGNSVVALLPERHPVPGLALSEALEVSDLPAGALNFLSGRQSELLPHLAGHVDIDALELCGVQGDRREIEIAAADSIKRVHSSPTLTVKEWATEKGRGLGFIEPFVEIQTVWHPVAW